MAAMSLDPMPFDPVGRRSGQQLLPQLGILDGLLVGGAPAVLPPLMDPARDPVADVAAVGVQFVTAWPLECFKRLDRSHQLHSVVRRQRFAAGDLPLFLTHAKERGPAAWAGIALAR